MGFVIKSRWVDASKANVENRQWIKESASIASLLELHGLVAKMLLFLQVFVVTSSLIIDAHCFSIEEEDTPYTDIQSSNIYCHSLKTHTGARKVVCDFRHTVSQSAHTAQQSKLGIGSFYRLIA